MNTIRSFKGQASYDIVRNVQTKKAIRRLPMDLWNSTQKFLNALNNANEPDDLKRYGLEKLTGDRSKQFSMRINVQYRICFEWNDGSARLVEVTDYHD